jgi:long-chain acyl-CoA synthetase
MRLGDILELTSARAPDRTALVAGQRSWTYQALTERCHRLSHALRGVAGAGDRVALLAENVPEVVDAYYAVPSAGMILTFLNYRLHPRELAWILSDSGSKVLIAERHLLEPLRKLLTTDTVVSTVVVIDDPPVTTSVGTADPGGIAEVMYQEFVSHGGSERVPVAGSDDDTAWLLYTSGTTGFPKGAMLSHRNLMASTVNAAIECSVQSDDRALMSMPLCHISSHMLLSYHLRAATVVIQRRFHPDEWLELVDEHRITATALAPTLAINLLGHPKIDSYRLDSFRRVIAGAGAMPVAVLERLISRFGPVLCSAFGMTEASGSVTQHPASAFLRALDGEEHLLAACGRAMCLCELKIVDESFEECPRGMIGEIVVRGDQVIAGYWKNELATTEAFTDGWLHTGDLGKQDDEGYFYVVDRLKDMIKTGGENVYSREVEEALYHHPQVRDAAVIALPDDTWGERVTAVVVVEERAARDADGLLRSCHERLAGFKVPKQVIFVDELPRNASGKVLKRELRARYQQPRSSQ